MPPGSTVNRKGVPFPNDATMVAVSVSMAKTGQSGFYNINCVDLLRRGMTVLPTANRLHNAKYKHLSNKVLKEFLKGMYCRILRNYAHWMLTCGTMAGSLVL